MKQACSKVIGLATAAALVFLVSAAFSAQAPLPGLTSLTGCGPAQDRLPLTDRRNRDCVPQLKQAEMLGRPVSPPVLAPLNQQRIDSALHQWKAKEAEALAVPGSAANHPLRAYLDGRALEATRSRALREAELSIKGAEARILSLGGELNAATNAANDWIHRQPGRDLPSGYRQRIVNVADAILAENLLLRRRSEEREQVNQLFDRQLHRVLATEG